LFVYKEKLPLLERAEREEQELLFLLLMWLADRKESRR